MTNQRAYWERAGAAGYLDHMFASRDVGRCIMGRVWGAAFQIGYGLGLRSHHSVLDLGCGDGAFANQVLASYFRAVRGIDFSAAAISHARLAALNNFRISFGECDLTTATVDDLTHPDPALRPNYDGAFLIGILHHVKPHGPAIVNALRDVTSRVIVLEPNGSHPLRKLLELTPSYRAAGEDSFMPGEVTAMFSAAGFRQVTRRPIGVFPNRVPRLIYNALARFEPVLEKAFPTNYLYGFAL